jgi:endoglycosylceramidase
LALLVIGLAVPPFTEAQNRLPLRLHVAHGVAPAIVDGAGRQVLLRGVNTGQLADYYRFDKKLPSTVPLKRADFREMSRMGFDVVRLVVSWSKLEPRRGEFGLRYLRKIRRAVRWAGEFHIYVVLDMHQDQWGKFVFTPRGETCAKGTFPNIGWDGAPRWATFTDGLSTCFTQRKSDAPAVQRAWESLWLNREGIQDELVRTWGRLAHAFAANPDVAGYDLLNEPNLRSVKANERALLGNYYASAIAAIRSGEDAAGAGFHHIVFFEPGILWPRNGTATHTPSLGFTDDRQIAFAPHLYAGANSTAISARFRRAINLEAELTEDSAASFKAPPWVGEWGWFGNPVADRPKISAFAHMQDAHLLGGAWWQWKQACGSPAAYWPPSGRPRHRIGNLFRYRCPGQVPRPSPQGTVRILSRAYPLAAPGRLDRLRSRWRSGKVVVEGQDVDHTGSPWLKLWIPARGQRGIRLEGIGRAHARIRRVGGGWLVNASVKGRYKIVASYRPFGTKPGPAFAGDHPGGPG